MCKSNKDYYKILEISRNASKQEIRKVFRKLAMKYHPDRNKDPNAESKFKEINEAYSVLSDFKKCSEYNYLTSNKDVIAFDIFAPYVQYFKSYYGWFKNKGEFVIFNIFYHRKLNFFYINEQKDIKNIFPSPTIQRNNNINYQMKYFFENILQSLYKGTIYFANVRIKKLFYDFIVSISRVK